MSQEKSLVLFKITMQFLLYGALEETDQQPKNHFILRQFIPHSHRYLQFSHNLLILNLLI